MEEANNKPTPAIHHDELNVLFAEDQSGAEKAKVLLELLERGVFTAGSQYESDDDDDFESVGGSEVDNDDIGLTAEYPSPKEHYGGPLSDFEFDSFLNCQSTAVSPPDSSRVPIDPFQFVVSEDEFSTPVGDNVPTRPLTPHIITVDREPHFDSESEEEYEQTRLSRRDSFELELRLAKRDSDSIDSQRTVESVERPEKQPVRDPVQEEANRAYRERVLQSREAEVVLRSGEGEAEPPAVGKWDQEDEEPVIRIVTPPDMEPVKKDSKYDGPNADVRIDNVILPRDLPRFTMPAELNGVKPVFKMRDPSAERERPLFNLALPTPRQSPRPEAQIERESRLEPMAGSKATEPGLSAFEEDLDFAANLAAGLQSSGFDPDIVINDPTFQRRDLLPRSTETSYKSPRSETVANIRVDPNLSIPGINRGLVEGDPYDGWPRAILDDGNKTDQRISDVAPKESSHPVQEQLSQGSEEPTGLQMMNRKRRRQGVWFGGLPTWVRNHSSKFARHVFKPEGKKPEHLVVSAPPRELPAPSQTHENRPGIPEVQFPQIMLFAGSHHIAQPITSSAISGQLPPLRKADPRPTIEATTITQSSTTVINPPSSYEILLRTKIFGSRVELSALLCEPTWTPPDTGARCLIPKPEALQLHKLPPRETFAAKMIDNSRELWKEVEVGGSINISGVGAEITTKGLFAALKTLNAPQWIATWLSSNRDLYVCKHLLQLRDDESDMEKLHSIEDELMSIEKYQHGASEYMTVITYNDAMHSGAVTLLEALFDEHHALTTLNLVARVKDMPKKICQILCKEGKPSRYELKRSGTKVICRVDSGLPQPRPAAVSGEQEWRNIGGGWRRALHLILHDDSMSSPKEGLVATVPQMLALLHLRLRLIDCVPSTPIFRFEPPLSSNTGESNVSVRRGIKLLGPPSGASHLVNAGTITVLFSGESSWVREELFWA